jgi:hypothetical protein
MPRPPSLSDALRLVLATTPTEHPEPPPVAAVLMTLDGPDARLKRALGRDMLEADNYGVWVSSFPRGLPEVLS